MYSRLRLGWSKVGSKTRTWGGGGSREPWPREIFQGSQEVRARGCHQGRHHPESYWCGWQDSACGWRGVWGQCMTSLRFTPPGGRRWLCQSSIENNSEGNANCQALWLAPHLWLGERCQVGTSRLSGWRAQRVGKRMRHWWYLPQLLHCVLSNYVLPTCFLIWFPQQSWKRHSAHFTDEEMEVQGSSLQFLFVE